MGGLNIPQFWSKNTKNSINLGHMDGYIIKNSQKHPNFGLFGHVSEIPPTITPQIYDIIMKDIAKTAIFNPKS